MLEYKEAYRNLTWVTDVAHSRNYPMVKLISIKLSVKNLFHEVSILNFFICTYYWVTFPQIVVMWVKTAPIC